MINLKVFIFAFNRPDLLQKQLDSFSKYLVGDYDINVVYDHREDSFGEEFKKICNKNNVNLHYHKSNFGNVPSGYHGQCMNWVYSNLIEDDDYVIFLDHDMFLIDNFDLTDRLSRYDVLGHKQDRGNFVYFWPGLFMFNYSKIKHIALDFSPCIVNSESLDSGGGTFKIFEDGDIKVNFFDQEYPDYYQGLNLKDPDVNSGFVFELFDNGTFLHTHNASHWHNGYQVNDKKKTEVIFAMLDQILTGCYDVNEKEENNG